MEQRLTDTGDVKPLIKKETGRAAFGPSRLWWLVDSYTNPAKRSTMHYHRNSLEYLSCYIRGHYMIFRGEEMGGNSGAFFIKSRKMDKGITALGFILLGQMMQNYNGISAYTKNITFKRIIPRDEIEALLSEGGFHYREAYDHTNTFVYSVITF